MIHAERSGRGQALVEFALIFPMFVLVLFTVIVVGLYVFYNQQLENAAREAARYAVVHSANAQCPTVSRINPLLTNRPDTYTRNCDSPEGGWPKLTDAARSKIWAMAPNQVSVAACWSGYTDQTAIPPDADVLPTDPNAVFTDCTIGGPGHNPRTDPSSVACPAPATVGSAYPMDDAKADGDDKASSLSYYNGVHYPTTVTVYTCFNWRPPMAGFVVIPSQITIRGVVTEVLQRQQ